MTRQDPSSASALHGAHGLGLLHGHAGRSATVAPRIWAGVTVQVAWTLLSSSVRVRANTLRDARDHVLLMLPPDTTPAHAADRAVALTREFVNIARRRVPDPPSPDTDRPLSASWRKTLMAHRSEYEDLVLREHFENTRSLDEISRTTGVAVPELEGARVRVREVLRAALIADRVTAQEWPAERLDALIERLVTMTWGTCPSMQRVLRGAEREHVRRCSVCGRARRLVNAGTVTADDLILAHPVPWPRTEGDVLAIHLHPDARRDRDLLGAELGVPAFPVGDDLLFVDLDDADEVHRVLLLAAEAGLPSREHLRAVVVRGPLRWSNHGLLGPLVRLGASRVRGASWGLVGGLGELPRPLPPPPSARPVWAVAALLAVVTVLVATQRIVPANASVPDVEATFTPARGGVWAEFDARDTDLVHIVRQVGTRLDVVLASTDMSDKVQLAVGDGSYRAHIMGDGVMVIATDAPIDDLALIVDASSGRVDALAELERRLLARLPTATIERTATASP